MRRGAGHHGRHIADHRGRYAGLLLHELRREALRVRGRGAKADRPALDGSTVHGSRGDELAYEPPGQGSVRAGPHGHVDVRPARDR